MFSLLVRFFSWNILRGGLSSLFVALAGWRFYDSAQAYMGYCLGQLDADFPLLGSGLLISVAIMVVFVLYRQISRIFNLRANPTMDRLLRFSFPLVFLCLIGYLGLGFLKKNADPLYSTLGGFKHEEVYKYEKKRLQYDHVKESEEDRDYFLKAVRNRYARFVYDDMIKDLPKSALNRLDKTGKSPLLYAILDGNEEALDAMLVNKSVNLNQLFGHKVWGPLLNYKAGRGALQDVWDWFSGEHTLSKYKKFSVAKIAYLKGKRNQARKIGVEGERRGWTSGWRSSYYYWSEGDPTIIPKQ